MTRVPNLLPTVAAARPEASVAPTSGRDFDDVLARTYQDRPRDTAGRPEHRPTGQRPDPDRSARTDQSSNPGNNRPESAKPVSRQQIRAGAVISTSRARARDDQAPNVEDLDDPDAGRLNATGLDRPVTEADRTTTHNDAETGSPAGLAAAGHARDILAEPVAGLIADPALLAAMVTTAPTLLTPATAPEPEAGMLSVASVDGGTAVIVTAPGSAAVASGAGSAASPASAASTGAGLVGGPPNGPNLDETSRPAGNSGALNVDSPDLGTASGRNGSAQAIPVPTPSDPTSPVAATIANDADMSPTAAVTGSGAAQLAATLTPVTGTTPPLSVSVAESGGAVTAGTAAGTDGSSNLVPGALVTGAETNPARAAGTAPATGTSPSPASTSAFTDVDAVPSVPATAPTVDPVAAALAGVYGTERIGSLNGPSGPIPGASHPDGAIGSLPPGGTGLPGAVPSNGLNDSNGTDSSNSHRNPGSDGSAALAAQLTPNDVPGVSTAGMNTAPGAAAAGLPVTPGIAGVPVPGINGLPGVTGLTGATATPAIDSSARAGATSQVSDQVAAQIGRQLHGVRMLNDGTHHTVLRLSPEHLGEVTITLDVRAGGIRLDLAAGSQALAALQADLGHLRDNLAVSGLDLADVTLSSHDAGPGTNGQAAARERWESAPNGRERPGDGPGGSATPADRSPDQAIGRTRDGGLDVLA